MRIWNSVGTEEMDAAPIPSTD